jgi:hypothetical protein
MQEFNRKKNLLGNFFVYVKISCLFFFYFDMSTLITKDLNTD